MQKIVPHLWYDTQAKEAALFYISLFDQSRLVNTVTLKDTPSGDSEIVSFELAGMEFMSISAGPFFKFNPSISLMVTCDSIDEVDYLYEMLVEGGSVLMPLDEYPFSKRYVWLEDRYGLSWQLIFNENSDYKQKIIPSFLFSNEVSGKAKEAINFYMSIFNDSKVNLVSHYEEDNTKINYANFILENYHLIVMDNTFETDYNFNEAFSLLVYCDTQEKIDYYWNKLSAVLESEQCGWLKDKFGVSWQITSKNMNDMLLNGSEIENERVTKAFLQMKKIDLVTLENARKGI